MFNNPLLDVHEVAEDKIETTQFKGMVNIGDETPKFWSSDALKIKKG